MARHNHGLPPRRLRGPRGPLRRISRRPALSPATPPTVTPTSWPGGGESRKPIKREKSRPVGRLFLLLSAGLLGVTRIVIMPGLPGGRGDTNPNWVVVGGHPRLMPCWSGSGPSRSFRTDRPGRPRQAGRRSSVLPGTPCPTGRLSCPQPSRSAVGCGGRNCVVRRESASRTFRAVTPQICLLAGALHGPRNASVWGSIPKAAPCSA
jgi:hypothetical protein